LYYTHQGVEYWWVKYCRNGGNYKIWHFQFATFNLLFWPLGFVEAPTDLAKKKKASAELSSRVAGRELCPPHQEALFASLVSDHCLNPPHGISWKIH
jgi:hypothetical protein